MQRSKYDISAEQAALPGTSHALMAELVGANKRVLDVGCDTGYLGRVLIGSGNQVSGVEVNPVSAEEAAKHLDRVVVRDLEDGELAEDFPPGSFDVVLFGDVLEHLRDPVAVLRQARPVLAPGGSVVISVPNIAHGDVRLALLQGRFDYTKVGLLDDTHLKFFTRDSLVTLLHDAGFVLSDLRRSTAPLFTTELGVHEADFDAELVAALRSDPEATTYQFVVRGVRDDAASYDSLQALQIDELRTEAAASRAETEQARARLQAAEHELAQARGEIAALRERIDNVQQAHDLAVQQRDEARARLHATLSERVRSGVRRVRQTL